MYVFMGHMRYQETKPFPDSFWNERRIDLLRGWVTAVDVRNKCLELCGQPSLSWDRLLIASGSRSNMFGWPGQDLDGVQGLYGLPDLKLLHENTRDTRHAVVVGGGLVGIELAEMLHSRNIHVTLLVRESSYCDHFLSAEESAMINRAIREQGMDLELTNELEAIEDRGDGRCGAVLTADGRRIECQLVGLTAGVSPNVGFLAGSGLEIGRGVLVSPQLQTNVPHVWAAGDCAEIVERGGGRNLVQQVWYTGKMQGEVAGQNIAGGNSTYDPGIWFNSAKFLDLEYQTYGRVNMRVPGEENLFWEDPSHRHSARIVHADGVVIGLQTMGLRWRHEVAERWISEGRQVRDALDGLRELAFDPEFNRSHEAEISRSFREQLS